MYGLHHEFKYKCFFKITVRYKMTVRFKITVRYKIIVRNKIIVRYAITVRYRPENLINCMSLIKFVQINVFRSKMITNVTLIQVKSHVLCTKATVGRF